MGPEHHNIANSAEAMPRQRLVLASLFVIGGAAVAAWLMPRDRGAGEDQVSALQLRIDALERQVAASQAPSSVPGTVDLHDRGATPLVVRDQAELRSELRAGAVPGQQAAPPFPDAGADAERRRFEASVFEQTLSAEQIDGAASNTFAEGLKQAFGGEEELAGNQLIDAQCRVTLCRIAVLQRSDDDVDSFLGNVGSLPGLENAETYWQRELNADGSSVMTMYVTRQGHKLPNYQMYAAEGLANRSDGP